MTRSRKHLWILIVASALLRCMFAAFTELSNDECFYRILALFPSSGYYAHPPMVAWLARLTTGGMAVTPEILIRLSSVIIGTFNTWLIFKVGMRIDGKERTGLIAALLYTGSIYASVFIGIILLPDGLLSTCWILALDIMLILARNCNLKETAMGHILMLTMGLVIGIGALSKYSAGYLWIAWILYILLYDRRWFTKWSFWLAGIISLSVFSPVIYWNMLHGFASITAQGSRLLNFQEILWWSPGREIAGNIGYQNPLNWIVYLIAVISFLKNRDTIEKPVLRILLLTSIPMIFLFFAASFTQPTLPHWCAPAYFSLMLMGALFLEKRQGGMRIAICSASILATMLIVSWVEIIYEPVKIPRNLDAEDVGRDDITLDMYGWRQGGEAFAQIYGDDISKGAMRSDANIIHNIWYEGAHLDNYFALPIGLNLLTFDGLDYEVISRERGGIKPGSDAYFISSSRTLVSPYNEFGRLYNTIDEPETIEIVRGGCIVEKFYVFRLHCANPIFK